MSPRVQLALLRGWHAWLSGAFLVAYLTADEDTYAMHLFAGYAVLAAVAIRLVAGGLAPRGSLWRLPRPSMGAVSAWWRSRAGRSPLFAWLAVALLGSVGLAAATGALADGMAWMEHPHEALSELSLWVIFAHIAVVTALHGGKRLWNRCTARRRSPLMTKETIR